MFESLKTKVKNLSDKKNKSLLAKMFRNPEYVQDAEERSAQLLFLQLLMIVAYIDDSIDSNEINMIKDYAFEHCLSEREWREIDFFRRVKPTKEEIDTLLSGLIDEINSKKKAEQFMAAIREIIEADDILKDEEKKIFELIENKLETNDRSALNSFFSSIKSKLIKKKERVFNAIDRDVAEYGKNPLFPVLKPYLADKQPGDVKVIAAKLGLAIIMIHADMEFHEKERDAFVELVEEECGLDRTQAESVAKEALDIPDTIFEIAYLARILADSTSEDDRKKTMLSLFKIARADQVYSQFENNYLRIISKYLFIEHRDFIALKVQSAG